MTGGGNRGTGRDRSIRSAGSTAVLIMLVGVLPFILAACAPGTETYAEDRAGFFSGIWHGWIAPVSIVAHFFNDDIRVYETNNTGIWYDVGFYMAVISGFGGLGLRRRGGGGDD